MNRRGELFVPYYNGAPWFEKPILLYWLAKPAVAILGEAGARLPAALALVGTAAAAGLFARRFGARAMVLAPMLLAGMILPAALGRLMMTDGPLVLAVTLALVAAYAAAERSSPLLWAAAGSAVGFGGLAKGPVALVLFVPPAIVAIRSHRGSFGGRGATAFLAGFVAVTATWYVPAYLRAGDLFVSKFLVEQNVGRFTGVDEAHTLGVRYVWLYVPVVLLGSLPFTPWALRVWRGGDARHRFLRTAALWPLLFFSISGAKLPHYVLPVFPPLAILVADWLAARRTDPRLLAAWTVALGAILVGAQGWWYGASGQAEAHAFVRSVERDPNLVLYRLSRREREKGTGSLRIRETSLPSLLFVADRTIPDVEELAPYADRPRLTVFTRRGRLTPADDARLAARFGLFPLERKTGEFYETVRYARRGL